MNKIFVTGNLTRDPETGATKDGVNWTRFSIAVRKRHVREGEHDAIFMRVTAWRQLGDNCAKYLAKGRKVAVVGTPSVSAWIGNGGEARGQLEVTADDVEFCSSSGGSHGPSDEDAPPDRGAAQGQRDPESGYERVDPEDQPF
jgi:single-strand DNA-binding protein